MTTTKKIVTNAFNVENAREFMNRVQANTDAYYVFVGNHIPYEPDDTVIADPEQSVQATVFDVYDNMIFGKKVLGTDVAHMIMRNEWAEDTVYAMYDHTDADLESNNFYTITQSGSYYHVYKCLDNNNGANSTVEPSGQDLEPFYTPSDGYMWKYMFTIPEATYDKFKTTNYVPIVANTTIEDGAVAGRIEHINVDDGGRGYDNYIVEGELRAADIQIGGSSVVYGITDDASALNDYYTNCVIKMTSGDAADEYRLIISYVVSGGQKKITLEEPFTNTPDATDTYEIYPFVYVFGDGNETANCIARALIDPDASNAIYRVEILDPGANYRYAVAVVDIMDVVDAEQTAELRPIISPVGGHGSDPISELFANKVGVSVKFSNTEQGYLTIDNDFRQVGIIKNPEFRDVTVAINLANSSGDFSIGEHLRQYRNIMLKGTVAANTTKIIVGTNTAFDTSFVSGDYIYFSDGSNRTFAVVNAVTNATYLTITTNNTWTASGCDVALVNSNPYGVVSALATGEVTITSLSMEGITDETRIFGNTSFAIAQVNTAAALPLQSSGDEINGLFNTYTEMVKFVGTPTSVNTAIIEDEEVRVESLVAYTQPTARFHSFANAETAEVMYVTNMRNIFNTSDVITNESNTVTFEIANKYTGDLVRDSGEVLYLENLNGISRASNKSETIKIILEF